MRLQTKMKMKNIIMMLTLALMLQMVAVQATDTIFDPNGDDEYQIRFTNDQGIAYDVPLITNTNGVFKYGGYWMDFVFSEGKIVPNGTSNEQDFTIGRLDYFLLSNPNNKRSHVMRYDSFNSNDSELEFMDMATGNVYFITYSTTNPIPGTIGIADLNFGGTTYKVHVANVSSGIPPLAIDMNSNGIINYEEMFLYTETGEIFDLGNAEESVGGTMNGSSWSNTGATIAADSALVRMYTPAGTFGTGLPSSVQEVEFLFEKVPNYEIDVTKVSGNGFNLSGTSEFTTYYGETFKLTKYYSGLPTTVWISSPFDDTEAPEFVLNYEDTNGTIEVTAVDNSNGTLTTTMAGMSLWDGRELHMYESTDIAGNSVRMNLAYKMEDKKTTIHILNLGYNQDPDMNLVSNRFIVNKNNGKLIQEIVVLPDYEASVIYNINRDESKISYRDPNNLNVYGASGAHLLRMHTNQGVLDYSTGQ